MAVSGAYRGLARGDPRWPLVDNTPRPATNRLRDADYRSLHLSGEATMKTQNPLFLHEELMLLALRDEEGHDRVRKRHVPVRDRRGRFWAELLLEGRVRSRRIKEETRPPPRSRTGRRFVGRRMPAQNWRRKEAGFASRVGCPKIAVIKRLKHRVGRGGLCERGILRAEQGQRALCLQPEGPTPN